MEKQKLFWFATTHQVDADQLIEQILSDYERCKSFRALSRKYRMSRCKIENIIKKKRISYKPKLQPLDSDIAEFCKRKEYPPVAHKLSEDQENQVRQRYKKRVVTLRELGEEFGVSYQTIANIVKGKY